MKRVPPSDVAELVARALAEDVGTGDLTAELIDAGAGGRARVEIRKAAVLCGAAWFDEVFRQLDATVGVEWHCADGDLLAPGTTVCTLEGPARSLLSGERTALNLLQTLSGTATAAHRYAQRVAGTGARILDTRKTLPGLRSAQKYAVRCGGGENHRLGLFDAILVKENHIAAVGGLAQAVRIARRSHVHVLVEVEVETPADLDAALASDADRLLLDNFSLAELGEAVRRRDAAPGRRKVLEASGGVSLETVGDVAATGVDYVSVGAMTKHLDAADFSMRFTDSGAAG